MTQHEKILAIMRRDPERWYRASDFMQPNLNELFVGYEATARLSELVKKGLLDTRQEGRFRAVRLAKPKPITPTQEAGKAVSWLND